MKRHSAIASSLFIATTLLFVSAAPASFAASSPTPKPKSTAKVTAKAKPTVKPTAKAFAPIAKPTTAAEGAGGVRNRFGTLTTVQRACLVKQGITIPAPRVAGAPRPTPYPSRTPGSFGGTRNSLNSTKLAAAYKVCGIKAPTGGFAGGTFNSAKFQAFQKCMTAAGVTTTGGFGRYDQSDPTTVAALVKCQKSTGFTLPKPGQPGSSN